MSPIDGAQWLDALRRGDEEATRRFVETYYDPLMRYLFRMLRDHQTAEDVCQELFVRAIDRIDQVRDPKGLKTWLYRIATNLARDHARRCRETPLPEAPLDWTAAGALPGDAACDGLEALGERLYLAGILRALRHEHQEVLLLRFYEDMSLPEIGEVLDIPLGTVKSRLHHALRQLRKALEKEREVVEGDVQGSVRQSRAYPSHVV